MTRWLHIEPLLAVILWGGVYPGAKLGLREIPVLSFTYLRILLATAVLCVISGRVQTWRLPRSLWKPLLKAGLAQTVFQLLLIAAALLGEVLQPVRAVGALLTFVGGGLASSQ